MKWTIPHIQITSQQLSFMTDTDGGRCMCWRRLVVTNGDNNVAIFSNHSFIIVVSHKVD